MMKAWDTFIIFFLALYRTVCVSGKNMVEEWRHYRNECLLHMSTEPEPEGVHCRRMFDMYACWSDGQPNSTVKVPCPWYLPWYDQGKDAHGHGRSPSRCVLLHVMDGVLFRPLLCVCVVRDGVVLRECGPDGQWATNVSSRTWRDHSQCGADNGQEESQEKQMMILACFRVMYTVGYCVSLASLSLALIILLLFRNLHCTRNYIHTNLFASFILRAASILTRDALQSRGTPEFGDSGDISTVFSDQAVSGCRVAQVLMHYCVGANYYWLLVEGLYLHHLLMAFSDNHFFCGYLLIGWGTPVLFVIPWIIVRFLFENTKCWEKNENVAHWWIIRTPILLAILVNFFIFIRIVQILASKLKAHQMRYTDYKFRLAKSTLTLIPLLGIHEVVFAVMTEEHTEGVLRNINLFFQLLFSSFQVQGEIKKRWHRWKLGMSDLDDLRNTGSNMPQVGASMLPFSQCHHLSPCLLPAYCQEDRHPSAAPHPSAPPHPYSNRQDHPGAEQLKASSYIAAHTQDGGRGDSEEKSRESNC
ncbi:glucagon receptor isoform X2 [Xiphias gladius]|uniref:glucagon receptor isoform X2 n=1 Tax=Xiphias gladius TaxID=8245 RepID=UPI001A9A1370|nr:glucagon receptor isoform X2 [Xiphias gladius]